MMIPTSERAVRARAIAEAAFTYPPSKRAAFLARACSEDTVLGDLVLDILRERNVSNGAGDDSPRDRTAANTTDARAEPSGRRRWLAPTLVAIALGIAVGGWTLTRQRDVAREDSVRAHAVADRMSDLVERSVDHLERSAPATADSVLRSLLDLRLESLGHGHPSTRQVRRDLARIAARSGSYTRAESLRLEQVTEAEDRYGPNHTEVADDLIDLGQLMLGEGKLGDALAAANRAIEIYQRNDEHIERAGEAHLLAARTRLGLDDLPGAEASFHASVAALRELPERSRTLADALEELGAYYQLGDRASDAEVVLNDAVAVRRADSSGKPSDLARAVARLADARSRAQSPEAAVELWKEAVELYQTSLGVTDARTLSALTNYGLVLTRIGRTLEAEPPFQTVVANEQYANSFVLARAYAALGYLYHDEDRLPRAESHLRLALDHQLEAVGLYDESTAGCMIALADVLGDLCRADEAVRLYDHAIAVCDSIFDEPNATRSSALVGLGELLTLEGRSIEAEPLLRQAHLTYQRLLGETHPATIAVATTLALCLSELGDAFEAEKILQANLNALARCCDEDDPETTRALDALWKLRPEAQR